MTEKEARRLLQVGHAELEQEDDSVLILRISEDKYIFPQQVPGNWVHKGATKIRIFKKFLVQ